MIIKNRKIPEQATKIETLLNRLTEVHLKTSIEVDLSRILAGFRGEQSIDYYLNLLRDNKKYFILHDLRLLHDTTYFQLDTLILSPTFFLIIEVKNISGTLFFDKTFKQLIRTTNGVEELFPDPITQVERQKLQFERWMNKQKFPTIPIETLVVMTNSQSILKTNDITSRISKKVIHSNHLLNEIYSLEKKHKETKYPPEILSNISKQLIENHTPRKIDILERYNIKTNQIIKGIQCPKCLLFNVKKAHGTWKCPDCFTKSKASHIQALKDYALLLNTTINNQQTRGFLKLSSTSVASKLLVSLNLPYSGSTKNRKYHLHDLIKI